jgi:hypothetical protein
MGTDKTSFEMDPCGGSTGSHVTGSDVIRPKKKYVFTVTCQKNLESVGWH